MNIKNKQLTLQDQSNDNIIGIINATKNKIDVNKFLFIGSPGTGKTA
ncbi:hypothetical protein [Mycoplasma leachii]|nr:hypothetical protein [Mycoplasma leachii]